MHESEVLVQTRTSSWQIIHVGKKRTLAVQTNKKCIGINNSESLLTQES